MLFVLSFLRIHLTKFLVKNKVHFEIFSFRVFENLQRNSETISTAACQNFYIDSDFCHNY